MIRIIKDKEPKDWEEYRNTKGVAYQAIPSLVDSLYREQGYICAYCMRRIPCKDTISNEDHHVEHLLCREKHIDKSLDYNNMVVCCPGHIGTEDHCDRLKGNKDISFSLFDETFIETISYMTDGEIVSSNKQYNKEINEVLNLNTQLLKANRKETWNSVLKELMIANNSKQWSKATLEKYIRKFSCKHNKKGKLQFIPYCGIVIYNLKKKLRQIH